MSIKSPVKALNAEVARKIAAGEVIDRPASIIRELMDNAIDSGASSITVEISGGGIEKIRIVDNGSGMTKDDLFNAARPHSTSKIQTEKDLLNLSTLGFRGEALASIAAVSRLSITSGGWKMKASITEDHLLEKTAEFEGTIVQSEGLFENFPARRVFLKREATEGTLCKSMFVEKCIPQHNTAFKLVMNGEVRLNLPKNQTLKERFLEASEIKENPSLFYQVEGKSPDKNDDWSFSIIIGEPGIRRPNKKDIQIFLNGRKIQEYSLVQAIEYGCKGFFPNGTFPVAAAFIQIDPSLVDFNIHPAKREVKFKDISALHHGVSSTINNFWKNYTNQTMEGNDGFATRTTGMAAGMSASVTKQSMFAERSKAASEKTESNFQSPPTAKVASTPKVESGTTTSRVESTPQFASTPRPASFTQKNIFTPSSLWERTALANSSGSGFSRNDFLKKDSDIGSSNTDADFVKREMDKIIENYTAKKEPTDPLPIKEESAPYTKESTSPASTTPDAAPVPEFTTEPTPEPEPDFHSFKFLGSALGTFILCENDGKLYIIDKHAAHERMLFDSIMENQGKYQSLLIPYTIETKDENEDRYLESILDELKKIGFNATKKSEGTWEFNTLNERWKGSEEDLEHAIFDNKVAPKDLIYSMAAMTACKAAVKDGWTLADSTAEEIAKGALSLKDPHCPHGRPCYFTLSREELFHLVRRTE